MKNLSLRGLDDETVRRLKLEARRAKKSVNSLVLDFVRRGVGVASGPGRRATYHDLDGLAGTWSRAETNRFLRTLSDFEKVDRDLWA